MIAGGPKARANSTDGTIADITKPERREWKHGDQRKGEKRNRLGKASLFKIKQNRMCTLLAYLKKLLSVL